MVYFTRRAGKYEILIPRDGKKYFPERPKIKKKYFPKRRSRAGKYFFSFGPQGEVFFTITRDEYFILTQPPGEV